MTVILNWKGYDNATQMIAGGRFVVDRSGDRSEHHPNPAREDALIRLHGLDAFAKWHLGINDEKAPDSKEPFAFPFGGFAAVHRCALVTTKMRTGNCRHREIHEAAES